MRLVEFTDSDGCKVFINPEYVDLLRSEYTYDGKERTTLRVNGSWFAIQDTPGNVIRKLEHKHVKRLLDQRDESDKKIRRYEDALAFTAEVCQSWSTHLKKNGETFVCRLIDNHIERIEYARSGSV